MLHYLYADQLNAFPTLRKSMFQDRACQFKDRLNWEVEVDENGFETDQYDAQNPMYAIWADEQGRHCGSMRVLPTTGPCMTNDHFSEVAGGTITSPLIWESTRFCLSRDLGPDAGKISAGIMLAGCEIGLNFGLKHAVGVFDPRMVRIYRMMGWAPEIIGETGAGRDKICVGLWEFSRSVRDLLCDKAGVAPATSLHWFNQSFNIPTSVALVA
jgi:acyl homoserine lactone synthase